MGGAKVKRDDTAAEEAAGAVIEPKEVDAAAEFEVTLAGEAAAEATASKAAPTPGTMVIKGLCEGLIAAKGLDRGVFGDSPGIDTLIAQLAPAILAEPDEEDNPPLAPNATLSLFKKEDPVVTAAKGLVLA